MGFMFCDLHVSLNNPVGGYKFVEFALLKDDYRRLQSRYKNYQQVYTDGTQMLVVL